MDLLLQKIIEQLILVSVSVLSAIFIGVPLGILSKDSRKLQTLTLSIANIFQTIPSLALLAILLPVFGIGMTPALIALTLYALLPILRNTVVGFQQIPHIYIEAARDLGCGSLQCLWKIELPLALPIIIAGIRTAVAMTVGIATIAAFIGAGGLGDFITRGLAMDNNHLLLLGAIPAALIALILDSVFAHFQKRPKHSLWIFLFIIFLLIFWFIFQKPKSEETIRVGTKNFSEQYILGEMISQLIEAKTNLKVDRKFNLGSTEICQKAMENGEIDLYPEYSGTAYMTVLHQNNLKDEKAIYNYVKENYQIQYHIIWLSPFGFNNSQSLTIREDLAKKYHIKTITDLIPYADHLILGAPPEFLDRSDGYPAVQETYSIHFKNIKSMDPGLMYPAIELNKVDVIDAFTTDGRIPKFHLEVLQDNKKAFPAYKASPLIRESILKKHPELISVMNQLKDQIDDKTMQQLNAEVDIQKETPAFVAHQFLLRKHLL
jgi:osmoprotectant transport system permease protein